MTHTTPTAPPWLQRLPPRLQAYALLMRLDRPIGAWLLFLPGLWSIALTARGMHLAWLLVLFACGAVLMRAAGCIVNDLWDRDIDKMIKRTATRPLVTGQVSTRDALILLAVLLSLSLGILLQLNDLARALGILSILPVALYPLAKRFTWWAQLVLGITFGWGALLGYAAGCHALTMTAMLIYGGAIFWILAYDTIYAHQDREDDATIGVRSTARLFATRTRLFLAVTFGLMMLCLTGAGVLASMSGAYYVLLAGACALLVRQVVLLDIDDAAVCLALFNSNRDVGVVIGLAFLAGRL